MADKTPEQVRAEAQAANAAYHEVIKAMQEGLITPEQAFPVANALSKKADDLAKQFNQMVNGPKWT